LNELQEEQQLSQDELVEGNDDLSSLIKEHGFDIVNNEIIECTTNIFEEIEIQSHIENDLSPVDIQVE
jgi:hypothetical protein